MLKIDSNMTIRVNKGDDFAFPLFVNKGTELNPIRYEFQGEEVKEISKTENIKTVEIDLDTWKTKIEDEGQYTFIYDGTDWKLDNNIVSLDEYGITLTIQFEKELVEDDLFVIDYKLNDGCEVYFNLYDYNLPTDRPIFTKKFTGDDKWQDTKDIKIEILHTDKIFNNKEWKDLPPKEYVYQIIGKVLNPLEDEPKYVINKLTNRLKLYIIEDDYNNRPWED